MLSHLWMLLFLLWPPCIADADIIFLPCGFFLSSFLPHLMSAVAEWMSTILLDIWCGFSANLESRSEMSWRRLLEIQDAKMTQKNRHLRTIAQLCPVESLQLRHVSTIGKNLLNINTSSTCPHNMANFGPLAAEIGSGVCSTTANFNRFRVMAALLHGTLAVRVSQT